ncbi:PGC-1 and ERR-induced regulator in muscle protein 1 [Engraulis encrasicolus]|uniref:PGC-1 and ERR-induced regulator in muscle protein 1 n=1 Tax=Engraulis encrasicolus TaxID=184585 RepID=UPI002FD11107
MDDFEYSVQMSEKDWNSFFQECEECDLLPPVLAGLDDSGMSDFDEFGPHRRSRQGRDTAQSGGDLNDGPLHEESLCMDRYGLCSPDYVLSGSEDDMHIDRSVNRFFEHLRSMANIPEQSHKPPTANGNAKRTQGTNKVDFPPTNGLPKTTPLGAKNNQSALGSGDVKPKSKADCRFPDVSSKATADWYARSMMSALREDWPVNQNKDTAHNNNKLSKDTLPAQRRSSDTGPVLSSALAGCRNGPEVLLRGDEAYGLSVPRKASEYPEGQSPCVTPRRKKKRKKRMSMEPVEAGHSYEGQFTGALTDSDEDRHLRRTELEKPQWGSLPGEFGTVKMADKSSSDPKRLSLHNPAVIDSLSDQLPVQANSRTRIDRVTGPRELSTAGNQADSIDLPRALPQGTYNSQTVGNTEPQSRRSTDMSKERCLEAPLSLLSPLQRLMKGNSCKPDESPVSANVKDQTETPTHIFNSSVSTHSDGDKVLGNSTQTSTQLLEAQKSDQVQGCHSSVDPEGSQIVNRPKTAAHTPPGSQIGQTGQPLSQNGVLEGEGGHSHPSASLAQINNTSPLDPGKPFPMGDSSVTANAQNDIRPKLANGHIATAVDALKCTQLVKLSHEPPNKDSSVTLNGNLPHTAPSNARGANLQTLLDLLDSNNKPSALPAHLHGPAAETAAVVALTATCPPALGNAALDKQMQIRVESAELADHGRDNTRSKQIIAYPAEADPKCTPAGPLCCTSPSSTEETDANKHDTPPPVTREMQNGQPKQLSKAETDSGIINSYGKGLCDLSKASDTEKNVALESNCTDESRKTGSGAHDEMSVLTKPTTEYSDTGNSQLQRSSDTSNAVVKEPCKAVSAQSSQNKEAAKPATDAAASNASPHLPPEEDKLDTIPEKKDADAVSNDPPPVFAMSSFWNEMEKLTINDILRLRMVGHAQHPSILTPLAEDDLSEASHARDSGYFTHVDDTRPDRSSGDMSTMSDFDEEQDQEVPKQELEQEEVSTDPSANILWVNEPDSPSALAETEDVLLISTDTAIPQSLYAEQQYFRKMCKNISMQNLRALENQPLRQILRNASVQSLRSLDDDSAADPFYHIDTSAQFSDDESVADGHGFSLSEMMEYLFCGGDDDAISTVSETDNLIASHISGTSVPETYDDFYTEFETSSLFFPEQSTGSDSSKLMPIFSCSRASSRNSNFGNVQFPEAYDYFFPDSPPQSDNEEEREHSPPIRVVSRYQNKTSTLYNTSDSADGAFWTSPLSLRKVRRKSLTVPTSNQNNNFSLVPVTSGRKTGRRPMQPFSVMGFEDQGSFPDPVLCDLESRIFRKLAEQQMRCPETTVVDPRVDAPLVPLKQSDMCLVCIAFASWVMKSVSPQGADTWKAVLLANISALSAIRYLRRYKYMRDEAAAAAMGAKPLPQSSQS